MVVCPVSGSDLLIKSGYRRNIDLTSNDGMKSLGGHGLIEFHTSEHGPVICYSTGIHTEFDQAVRKILYPDGTVEKAVFSMKMQMYKS